ncbi:hypothetical protein K431DRAFT_286060 [Polychaeton citri CBS 116435]|uniref:CCD97-like C-terminal domain-containing protein n=1 Tax=Polychaeton citri CBS 116435 TaxID=1314669 RepID=A0A9P4UNX0_9PEZI|nr:hypothetical protein K431DRAFT_286060 [Polychaeton citri CBS 116435]
MLEAGLIRSEAKVYNLRHPDPNNPLAYQRASDGSIVGVDHDIEDRVTSKEEGFEKWKDIMSRRFVSGDDNDFDYSSVDTNEAYDDNAEEERRKQETYFDKEEAGFVGEGDPAGETGIQDF